MERNTQTILHHLRKGDRFYKRGDKQKQVFEVLHDYPLKDERRPIKISCHRDGGNPKYPVEMISSTGVVFLRHAETND